MTLLSLVPPALLLLGCLTYVFWTRAKLDHPARKSQLQYLRERREVLYDNLRDLNFEYRAGKYPGEDYVTQRDALEHEAATLLASIDRLEAAASVETKLATR